MITLNASQLATLIGSRPDTTWRASQFWKYFGRLCRFSHEAGMKGMSQVSVFTPPCYELMDYSDQVDNGFIQYNTGRRVSCCDRVSRFFVDGFRWLFYGVEGRNCGRGRDDEKGHLELLNEHWAPITFPAPKVKRVVIDEVEICGIVDAIREDGMLVEIKSRQHTLFDHIPYYELAQLYAYMFLYDQNEITQIQFYRGKFRVHLVKFDPVIWGRLVTKIGKVKHAVETCLATPEDKSLYLDSPQQFVIKYMRMIC